MSTNIVYNGVTYTIPATDDVAWGDAVSEFLIAIPSGMLTKVGGSWALTGSDLDLGAAYGLSAIYLKTKTATPALAGVLRLAYADAIAWRASANNKDLVLKPDASNLLTWDAIALVNVSTAQTLTTKTINAPDNTITNIMNVNIAAAAAIAYSKLSVGSGEIAYAKLTLTGSIVNADIATNAAIAASKTDGNFGSTEIVTSGGISLGTTNKITLKGDPSADYDIEFPDADGILGQTVVLNSSGKLEWVTIPGLALTRYYIMVGNSSNQATPVNTNNVGEVKADESGGLTIKALAITNAMVSASAAVAFSKMAALTVSRALVSDGSGVVSASTTTAAEIGYVNGVTSAIQTQLGTKVVGPASAVDGNLASFDATTGKLIKDSGSKAGDFVTGPASSTDDSVARFNGTNVKVVQGSGVIIDDSNNVTGIETLSVKTALTIEDPGASTNKITINSPTLAGNWELTLPDNDGSAGQYLKTDGDGNTTWDTPTGAGDVVGISASVDNEIARFDSTTGKRIQGYTSGGPTVGDTGDVVFHGSAIFNEAGADKDFRVEGDTDANLIFADASTDRVGIGTNIPGSKIHMHQAIASGSDYIGGTFILSRGWDGTTGNRASGVSHFYDATDTKDKLMFGVTPQASGGDPTTEANTKMVITEDGNVGIGTVTPNGRLQITGGTANASDLATSYSAAAVTLVPKSTSGYSLAFGSGPNDFPYIQMSASGSAASNMSLQPYGGNVGIGEASPANQLVVRNQSNTGTATDGCSILIKSDNRSSNIRLDAKSNSSTALVALNETTEKGRLQYSNSTDAWTLQGNGTTVMFTVTSAGAMQIGPATGLTTPHEIRSSSNAAGVVAIVRKITGGDTTSNYYLNFTTDTTDQGYIWNNASNNLEIATASDIRLKENIRDADYGLEQILQLRPVLFDWKSGSSVDNKGFIAQEVQKVFPRCVNEAPNGYLHLGKDEMIPVLVKAIQDQQKIIDDLKIIVESLVKKDKK